jgi:hypothetical protein
LKHDHKLIQFPFWHGRFRRFPAHHCWATTLGRQTFATSLVPKRKCYVLMVMFQVSPERPFGARGVAHVMRKLAMLYVAARNRTDGMSERLFTNRSPKRLFNRILAWAYFPWATLWKQKIGQMGARINAFEQQACLGIVIWKGWSLPRAALQGNSFSTQGRQEHVRAV